MDKMIRVRGEIPQFKRCCMCLPLRHGLIVWGYIRLVIGVILFVCATHSFFQTLAISKKDAGDEVFAVIIGFLAILGGADIVLNVMFVYAGHTKNLKMMKAYYIYSFILWILMIIMGVSLIAYVAHEMKLYQMDFLRVCISLFEIIVYFLAPIVIQAYVLLLVRSKFIKLTTDCEFRFVNNAAESTCKITCEEDNIANGNIIAKTHAIADGDVTANIIIIGDGDKKELTQLE